MNSCVIDTREDKSKNLILEKDLFGKNCQYLVQPLKAGDLMLTWDERKYCAELKIDGDWINSYNSKDWIEKIGNLIKEGLIQDYTPIVLVTLSDDYLETKLTRFPKWNQYHDVALWIKKFYDIKERILITYPHVIFKLCFDTFPKEKQVSALESGLVWLKSVVEGTQKEKPPIVFDHPILVRDQTKTPVLALASLCDGITEQTAYDILKSVGSWEKLFHLDQDQLISLCKTLEVSKYNFVGESIYVGLRLCIPKDTKESDAKKDA